MEQEDTGQGVPIATKTHRVLYKSQPFSALKIAQPASEDARRRLEDSHHL